MMSFDEAPMDEEDFEAALATAKDGFSIDWPFPDPVLTALEAVLNDPSDANIDAARAAWRASAA